MKNFYFSFIFVFCANLLSAQIVFQEDFDNISGSTAGGPGTYTFPSGWLLRNVDNRTPAVAYVNEAWERREDFKFNVIDSAAVSTSWYSPAGSADDWMWTPEITLPSTGDYSLKWNAVAYDPDYRDGYEVRIMQSPNTPSGGTGALGNQITNSTLLYSNTAENASWTTRDVTLNSYRGTTFRIAFRNNSNDQFLLWIDDIMVGEASTLSTIDLPRKKNFFIAKNPVENNTLIIHSLESTNAVVYDISGKKIKSFDLLKGKNVIDINISKGVYVLKTQDGSSSKLIVE